MWSTYINIIARAQKLKLRSLKVTIVYIHSRVNAGVGGTKPGVKSTPIFPNMFCYIFSHFLMKLVQIYYID